MGLLELEFGGRDADLCATLRVPADLRNLPVTLSIEPFDTVVDATPVTTTTGNGTSYASWKLVPGIEGEWVVTAEIETSAGVASAKAVASTGLTDNPRQNESPPCPR